MAERDRCRVCGWYIGEGPGHHPPHANPQLADDASPRQCPLCGKTLLYEEGSSGGTYAFCDEHNIIGDLSDDMSSFDYAPWVKRDMRAKLIAEYEAEHGAITDKELARIESEWIV